MQPFYDLDRRVRVVPAVVCERMTDRKRKLDLDVPDSKSKARYCFGFMKKKTPKSRVLVVCECNSSKFNNIMLSIGGWVLNGQ